MSQRLVLAVATVLGALFGAETSVAQIPGVQPAYQPPPPRPMPPPAIPVVPPPVDHPAYAGQPAMNKDQNDDEPASEPAPRDRRTRGAGGPGKALRAVEPAAKVRAREFLERRVAGKDLEKAVARLKKLHWHETMMGVRSRSASSGKPILWLNSLGELDGYA